MKAIKYLLSHLTSNRMFCVFLNSFYSFYWDVSKDWDLSLFSSSSKRKDPEHPYGLRKHRFFPSDKMYYAAIVVDFLLRCTWSFKLSPHLDHFNDLEGGIFTMEILEVARRWVWIFLRAETEWGESSLLQGLFSIRYANCPKCEPILGLRPTIFCLENLVVK